MSEDHFTKLKNMYLSAPNHAHCVPDLTVYKASATVTITVRPRMLNAGGTLDAETCMKALMDAAYYSASSLETKYRIVMSTFNVYFLRPVTSGVVTAKGQIKHKGKGTYLAEAVLTDGSGESVARGSGAFMRGGIELIPEMGYKL